MKLQISEIVKAVNGKLYGDSLIDGIKTSEFTIENISTDTRKLQQNSLFIALKGETFDAHDFLNQVAISSDAKILLIDKNETACANKPYILVKDTLSAMQALACFYRRKFNIPVLAIVGSNGKTTTKTFLATIVKEKYNLLATEGNLNNHVGVPLTLFQLNEAHQAAIIEMGMNHYGEIDSLMKTAEPQSGIILNIGLAHIEFFGSREGIFKSKIEMFDWLNANRSEAVVLYPAEDTLFDSYLKEKTNLKPVSFGFSDKADYKVHSIKIVEKDGNFVSEFKIRFGEGDFSFDIPFIGKHNVINAVAAMAYAREVLAVDFVTSEKALKTVKPAKWRSDLQKHSSGALILSDCYNANPSSFHALVETLELLKKETGKRIILVAGDMKELGEGSEKFHFELGEKIAKAQVDVLYSIGDFAKLTIEGATKAGIKSAQIETNKKEIYKNVINLLNCDTIFAIKGSRGAKLEELLEMFK